MRSTTRGRYGPWAHVWLWADRPPSANRCEDWLESTLKQFTADAEFDLGEELRINGVSAEQFCCGSATVPGLEKPWPTSMNLLTLPKTLTL